MRILFGIFGRFFSQFLWKKHIQRVHRFVDNRIEDASKELVRRCESHRSLGSIPEVHTDLVSHLLEAGYDKTRIRCQVIQSMILMRDTTSTLINNTLYLLSKRPDIWGELHKRLTRYKTGETWSEDGESLIDDCIKESKICLQRFKVNAEHDQGLRLYPVVGQSGRTALRDTILPLGGGRGGLFPVHIPAGCMTFNNFFALHRQQGVFGEDAEDFKPSRWADVSPDQTEYMPFGHGRRRCAGEEKALKEARYVIRELVQRFQSIKSRDKRDWLGEWKLVVKNQNGCHIAFGE